MSKRSRAALIRLLSAVPTLLAMSVFVFALIRLVPDATAVSTSTLGATPAEVSADGRTFGVTAATTG